MMNSIMNKKRLKNTVYCCIGILLLAFLYQCFSYLVNKKIFIPNISDIISSFFHIIGDGSTYLYIGNSLYHLLIALIVSMSIGISLGIISGVYKNTYLILKPIMSLLRILPVIIFIVLIMLVADLSDVAVITCILILIPIFYEGTYQGIINIDEYLLDVYKLNSSINLKVIFRVYLPLISSYSKSSFISSIGMGIKILVTTEYISGANNTIGKAIILAMNDLNYSYIYAYSLILIIVILLIEYLPDICINLFKLFGKRR
ncbi:MAG: ABC transporter permease [Anaeroplasma sp.]